MRNEWMEIFSQEGYRFCKVKPEETGVFYKYYGKVTGLPGRISGVPCGTADHSAHESV